MVLLNFGDNSGSIAVPFPKAGTYREMLDDDVRPSSFDLAVASDGEVPHDHRAIALRIYLREDCLSLPPPTLGGSCQCEIPRPWVDSSDR